MDTKKRSNPEDIIVGTDPVAIDIIQQIYAAIMDKNETDRTFLERCWVMGIEKAYKTETHKLDTELCIQLLERIYYHLEHKNIWDVEETRLSDIFERIISLKTLRDTRVKELFDSIERGLGDALQLNFKHKISIDYSRHEKRNIFNYMVFFFNSIVEKMENSMVSAKSINAFFSLYPGIGFIVTDKTGALRFVNNKAIRLLSIDYEEGYFGLNVGKFIKNYPKLISKLKKDGQVKGFNTQIITKDKKKKTLPVTLSIPGIITDKSEIAEIVFIIEAMEKA